MLRGGPQELILLFFLNTFPLVNNTLGPVLVSMKWMGFQAALGETGGRKVQKLPAVFAPGKDTKRQHMMGRNILWPISWDSYCGEVNYLYEGDILKTRSTFKIFFLPSFNLFHK